MSEKAVITGWYSKDYHYSRHGSTRFWKRVKAIKNDAAHSQLYRAGCELQNLEGQVLGALKKAEHQQRIQERKP